MRKFIIERPLPGAGSLTPEELQAIAKTSVTVITVRGKPYTWVESFVTDDKIYCIHEADTEDDIMQHSMCANFPVENIKEVRAMMGPLTAEMLE
jgi:hypothetical protein